MKVAPLLGAALVIYVAIPGSNQGKGEPKFCKGADGNRYKKGESYEDKENCIRYTCTKIQNKLKMKKENIIPCTGDISTIVEIFQKTKRTITDTNLNTVINFNVHNGMGSDCYSKYSKIYPYPAAKGKSLSECQTICTNNPECGAILMAKASAESGGSTSCYMVKPNYLFNEGTCTWGSGSYNAYEKKFTVIKFNVHNGMGSDCYSKYSKVYPYPAGQGKSLSECQTMCINNPECGAILMLKASVESGGSTSCYMIKPNNLFNEGTCTWGSGSYNAYEKKITVCTADATNEAACFCKSATSGAGEVCTPEQKCNGDGTCQDVLIYKEYKGMESSCYSKYTKISPYPAASSISLSECQTICSEEPNCGAILMLKSSVESGRTTSCYMIKPNNLFNEGTCTWGNGNYNAYEKKVTGLEEEVQKTLIVGYNKADMTKDDLEKEKIRIEKVCKCKVEHLESVGAFILTHDNPSHASISSLDLDPSKEIAVDDQIVTIFNEEIPTDPEFDQQWALQDLSNNADINAKEGWKKYMFDSNGGDSNGPSVVVAVIDTGVDYNHEDLRDIMWTNTEEIPGNGQDDDKNGIADDVYGVDFNSPMNGDPIDRNSHGTHCAGIIAAKENNGRGIAGVASFAQGKVKIMAVKGLSDGGAGSVSNLFRGLNYAIDNGATISSNSWGGGVGNEQLWRMVLQNNPNHLFVAAAGNRKRLIEDSYRPWTCGIKEPNLLCVASSTQQDTISSFSNYGKDYVHVFAPGSNIYSTIPGNGYATKSGTSMACPHVSGLAALIRTIQPDINAQQVRELIEANVQKKPQYENIVSSGGLIDMGKTLKECVTNGRDVETFEEAPEVVAETWEECSQMCRAMTECTHWVWRSDDWSKFHDPEGFIGHTKNACYRKVSSGKLTRHEEGLVTGDRNCGVAPNLANLVGTWSTAFTNGVKATFTIKPDGEISLSERKAVLEPSDDQVNFPTSEGWVKSNKLWRDATWSYYRVTQDGTLEVEHFRSDGQSNPNNFQDLDHYCCSGIGDRPVLIYKVYKAMESSCYSKYTKISPYPAASSKSLSECQTICTNNPECGAILMWKASVESEGSTSCYMVKPNNLFTEGTCTWGSGSYNAYEKKFTGY